jgi:flagellar motility protein MotE (MotC chaperone)
MIKTIVPSRAPIRFAALAGLCMLVSPIGGALAEDHPKSEDHAKSVDGKPKPVAKTAREEIKAFCGNIADAARDQRYLLQKEELVKLQGEVDKRIALLEERKTEYQEWLKRRNEFLKQAESGLTDIYKKMKPDAAAAQLQLLDPNLASAIIMKLGPSKSSLILTEMEAKKAAMVAAIMSAATKRKDSRNPS